MPGRRGKRPDSIKRGFLSRSLLQSKEGRGPDEGTRASDKSSIPTRWIVSVVPKQGIAA